MKIHFLEASTPLTKSYSRDADGSLLKTPYPFVWDFTSHDEEVETLADLEAALKRHAALGHCLLKGPITKPLVRESRAGSTQTSDNTQFIVLDLDGLAPSSAPTIDAFLAALGLGDISYIVQWSASYGITNQDLRAHIFMMLDKPMAATLLKQWLIQLNHTVPMLSQAMTLTKTSNAISWPLDISACQNDKLIYIAPPKLKGIKDPVAKGQRIKLVKRPNDTLSIGKAISAPAQNRELTAKRVNQLREDAGLPARKITYKMHGSTEVMVNPDSCIATESKVERGFVYFNLNGGDSWAYYHPEDNPDYIYSFKGEPAYLTKELLPDYWAQIASAPKISSSGDMYLAFCDRKTGTYWRGTYNAGTDLLDINQAKNETQVRHFAKQFGMSLPEFIPEWDLTFDPSDNVRVDPGARTVNLFSPSQYMLAAPPARPVTKIPPIIDKVITHVLGGDRPTIDHFINWLACVLQTRDRTLTSWVLHGTQGTGKGVLLSKILRPLFGEQQTASRRMEELDEPYNHWMKTALIVFIDEMQARAMRNERGVMAKLKNFITEDIIVIRAMYAGGHEVKNYTNWIFASNMPDPVSIDEHDRRFNVGKYQPHKIVLTAAEIDAIGNELQSFHDYLMSYAMDADQAKSVLRSEERDTLVSIGKSSVDTLASALLDGDFGFLVDQLPDSDAYRSNALQFNKVETYRQALKDALGRMAPGQGKCSFHRDDLHTIFNYVVGNMPDTPNKFTSLLKHHRIHIKKVRVPGLAHSVNGISVEFMDVDKTQFAEHVSRVSPPQVQVTPKPAAKPPAKPKPVAAAARAPKKATIQ